jgi:sec-independent protein translocase protein TatC
VNANPKGGARVAEPDDSRMPLREHLVELRKRMFISALSIAVGTVLGVLLYNKITHFLIAPYRDAVKDPAKKFLIIDPTQGITIRLKIGTYAGLFASSPVWLFQIWRFITPGLKQKEKRYAIPFILVSMGLFVLGAVIAIWTLPKALDFIIGFGGVDSTVQYSADGYLGFVVLVIAAFGICFEFPVVLVALQLVNILKSSSLLKGWRYAIVIIVVIAAVATPSQDPYSLFAMAIPMWIFYFMAIGIGKAFKK